MGSTKLELYHFSNQLYEHFNIDYCSFPIDSISLCSQFAEVRYHSFKTNGFCAAILLGEKSDTVVLNARRNSVERNFDCGHEIIHMTKHRDLGIGAFSCMDMKPKQPFGGGYWEWEANEGSAQFLIPHYSILPEIKKAYPFLKTSSDYRSFKSDMAEKYGVTDAVINYRFESLKYEIQQYLEGTPLHEIKILSNKQQMQRGIKVKSLNDIELELLYSENHVYLCNTKEIDVYK